MQIFSTKVAGDKVELKGELTEKLELQLSQTVSLEPLLAPALKKIAELIPGHFDDDLIAAALPKLEAAIAAKAGS
jgi:hypothetical protein